MPSRPSIEVRFSPSPLRPGHVLQVDATFLSRAPTRIDAVNFRLDGVEEASVDADTTARRVHVSLAARATPQRFAAGRNVCRARFPLPAGAPPSYPGRVYRVSYTLDVHVDIPWWPDARKRFLIPVARPAAVVEAGAPGLFATHPRGPDGRQLYAEASLDRTIFEPGDVIRGAVSFTNAIEHRVRGVHVLFVAREFAHGASRAGQYEARRYVARIHEGAVRDGAQIPFRITVPRDAPPGFAGAIGQLEWRLLVALARGRGEKPLLDIPIQIVPSGTLTNGARTRPSLPSVGRERRAQLWTQTARAVAMNYDEASDTLRARRGDVEIVIGLEHASEGFELVAKLSWPDLGLDLDVSPASLTDRLLGRRIETGDEGFDKAYAARGRHAALVREILATTVRITLSRFANSTLDDHGARIKVRDGGVEDSMLTNLATASLALADTITTCAATLPFPPPLDGADERWGAFAQRLNGRLVRALPAIVDATYGTEPVEIRTLWDGDAVDGTLVRIPLATTLEREVDPSENRPPLDAANAATARSLAAETRALHLGPDAVSFELDRALDDPAKIEPMLDRATRLARALCGRREAAPYR